MFVFFMLNSIALLGIVARTRNFSVVGRSSVLG